MEWAVAGACDARPIQVHEWYTFCHENGGPFSDEDSLWTINEQISYLNQISNRRLEDAKDEEKTERNQVIITDVSYTRAIEPLDDWNSTGGPLN
jgi:hypothetical protein